MIGQSFPEDLDCGNFFDNIDDLMDFPGGDIDDVGFGIGDSDSFPTIWTTHHDTWPAGSDPLFSSNTNSNSSPELYVPFEDIVKVERPSNFVEESLVEKKEDSFSINTDSSSSHNSQFRSSSPVSVLESSSSSSQTTTNTTTSLVLPGKHGRPRTKRPRPPVQDKDKVKDHVYGTDSSLIIRIPKQFLSDHNKMINNPKKKKAKVTSSSSSSGIDLEVNVDSAYSSGEHPTRKCMHCEVTKTPQWRLGPMGPKTLCNACGVRYKSGRLFPEYRPAASPTFTPALHSNSHKKVAEMRSKRCNDGSYITKENDLQDLIPNNAYIGLD